MLMYMVKESGIDPYQTRIIINSDYIRIDDDEGPNDFVLFDRNTGVTYSSASENEAILVVNKREVDFTTEKKLQVADVNR